MKKQTKILIPSYAEDFKCIGGECEDSCCIGWDIDIDKHTFGKYARTKNSKMKEKFEKHIYWNDESYSRDVDYGRIAIKDSKWCPFLEKDKFCEIQRNLGEDYLSNVCYSFPRVYNVLNGKYELSLYMSCPEAVRKLISSKDPIRFNEHKMPLVKHIVNSSMNTGKRYWKNTPLEKLPEMRTLSIEIIQNRSRRITERIIELGSRLEKNTHSGMNFEGDISTRNGNKSKYAFRKEFFRYVIESLGGIDETDSPVFAKFSHMIIEEFSLFDDANPETGIDLYEKAAENVVKPFVDENSYIFEHYLVNSIYQENFPFSENQNTLDGYVILVLRYALIQFYLAGIAAKNGKLTKEDVALMIQVHTKIINHHKTFMLNLLMEIKRKQYDNLDIMSLLLE